jgi:DNA gyrase/topoisomerase IV subunit B
MVRSRRFGPDSIRQLDFRETVRLRPFVWFPEPTANAAVCEAMCHAAEELAVGEATTVTVTEFASGHIRVEDDGRGWPNKPVRDSPILIDFMMTHGHAGCRHAHVLEAVQKLVCRASIGALNAICASMIVDSVHRGARFRACYRFGRSAGPVRSLPATKGSMLRFTFLLDARLLRKRRRLDHPELRSWWRRLPLPIATEALILRRAPGRPPSGS